MTYMRLRREAAFAISWWGYVDAPIERLKSSLIYSIAEPLHSALDEVEVSACQRTYATAKPLVKAVRQARNEMIGLAYSMLGADVSRDGDRNARLLTIARNVIVWLMMLLFVGWQAGR